MRNSRNHSIAADANSITAIARQGDVVQAVRMRRDKGRIELAQLTSVTMADGGWGRISSQLPSVQPKKHIQTEGEAIITGFESSAVFYQQLQVPYTSSSEFGRMVKMQAESHLPLDAEQMELAWRAGERNGTLVDVTLAAGRTEQLNQYLYDLGRIKPKRIILDSEAIVEVWKKCFGGNNNETVIISIGKKDTRICAAKGGQLINAATVDIGMDELVKNESSWSRGELTDRFAQDVCCAMAVFGYSQMQDLPVVLLSDGQALLEEAAQALRTAGLNARCALAEPQKIQSSEQISSTDLKLLIYEYRIPIGLAMCGFDTTVEGLDIFAELYSPATKASSLRLWHNPKASGGIAVAMAILLIAVLYLVDIGRLNVIEKSLAGSGEENNCRMLLEKQELVRAAAKERPDLLNLMSKISAGEAKDVILDSIDFKKGRPVTIKGKVGNSEQLYKYQKVLLNEPGISNVKIQSTSKAKKGGKLDFTIVFDYKRFTERSVNLLNR